MTGLDWMYMPSPRKSTSTTSTTPQKPAISTTTPTVPEHLRPHPGHETAWDSPIETPTHPILEHHHHHQPHNSGSSIPSLSPASPGFEAPWDSPIFDEAETPLTPLSYCGLDTMTSDTRKQESFFPKVSSSHIENAEAANKPQHPSLGQTDGYFGQRRGQSQSQAGCQITDRTGRDEFLWHMCGFCGCGRKERMTPAAGRC